MFQSTLPRGERLAATASRRAENSFNPRSRVGSDDEEPDDDTPADKFQSTLPRGERLDDGLFCHFLRVSIHAPAWGATFTSVARRSCQLVSIHAPAWGATRKRLLTQEGNCFNPRSRVGSDGVAVMPTRCASGFQSTLPRGERQEGFQWPMWQLLFQSTLPRGERLKVFQVLDIVYGFNPRSRVGSDPNKRQRHINRVLVSIHAPAWGATWVYNRVGGDCIVSIHAPAWGATFLGRYHFPVLRRFNPRSRVGSDPAGYPYDRINVRFQSTLPRGERLNKAKANPALVKFQSTLPRGERHSLPALWLSAPWFQSTLPRGERRVWDASITTSSCFNPRSRVGSDSKDAQFFQLKTHILLHEAPKNSCTLLIFTGLYAIQP